LTDTDKGEKKQNRNSRKTR